MPAPEGLSACLQPLTEAVLLARDGDVDLARSRLAEINSRQLQEWYDLHAQYAGRNRYRALGAPPRPASQRVDGHIVSSTLTRQVAERDHYTCRYCGQRLVAKQVFTELHKHVGQEAFPLGHGNYGRHGARLIFGLTIDHVVPHSQSGPTEPDNLVTACWPCNFGKGDYSLEEIGLTDPRERGPQGSGWRGLL